ncbi:putative NB-ARC domain-containing disease resistance protein [Hibiscus syriacus]|uniref:NB-ARC domain-containing disease resistance protein n=1 Tax=Hibiscus syriacus TaxID=106335 RepID=A0A6A2Z2R7_HIBSY|nr:putative NB-ARC domain-containing disease resistance protein [Hibiscus syriacus]
MAVQMAIRVSATARLSLPPPSSPSVEKTIDQVQEAGSSALDVAQQVFDVVGKALKPAIDAGVPIAKKAGEEALKVASPVISEASRKPKKQFKELVLILSLFSLLLRFILTVLSILKAAMHVLSIVDGTKWVEILLATAAKQTTEVIDVAKPLASSTFETITSAEPLTIVGSASALFVAYLLLPPIWSFISYSLRGYKGDLTPAQALDLISTQNYVMVDIRSEKDKDRDGVPRLPSSAKKRMIAIPKNSGENINESRFQQLFVVADGFSGSKGWLQSRLGTDTYNFSAVELLSPSTVFPTAAKRFDCCDGVGYATPSGAGFFRRLTQQLKLKTMKIRGCLEMFVAMEGFANMGIAQATPSLFPMPVIHKVIFQPIRIIFDSKSDSDPDDLLRQRLVRDDQGEEARAEEGEHRYNDENEADYQQRVSNGALAGSAHRWLK